MRNIDWAAAYQEITDMPTALSGIGKWNEEAEAAYDKWIAEQMTAGKAHTLSGLDLRSTGQKMNQIKGSVKQNDKIMGKIQPPKGL